MDNHSTIPDNRAVLGDLLYAANLIDKTVHDDPMMNPCRRIRRRELAERLRYYHDEGVCVGGIAEETGNPNAPLASTPPQYMGWDEARRLMERGRRCLLDGMAHRITGDTLEWLDEYNGEWRKAHVSMSLIDAEDWLIVP
jgi:hypothetical protein